jgi:hypothetical protein
VRWLEAVADLLTRSHLMQSDEIVAHLVEAMRPLGVDVTVYLVDREQRTLVPVPPYDEATPVPVDNSLGGRAFQHVESTGHLWCPMVDGTERLGVINFGLPGDDPGYRELCEMIAGLIGHLITTKLPYGDSLQRTRRSRRMTASAEILWQLLPPLTFSSERLSISAILQPVYEVGGDAFDYAVDDSHAHIMLLDAAGHGLRAGLAAAVALGVIRAARRAGDGLEAQAAQADAALIEQFDDARFATAVLVDLDLSTGRLRYVNAGHPPPLLVRQGKLVRTLMGGRRTPLGVPEGRVAVSEEMLQPGDRLLMHTDGITEAQAANGELFGTDRLVALTERHAADRLPAAETLRRLSHAVIEHQAGPPNDDATLLLLDWSAEAARRNVP